MVSNVHTAEYDGISLLFQDTQEKIKPFHADFFLTTQLLQYFDLPVLLIKDETFSSMITSLANTVASNQTVLKRAD